MFCGNCGRRIEKKAFKDAKTGKLICEDCGENLKNLPPRLGKFKELKIKIEEIEIPYLIPLKI